jgi:inner membrane protein
MKHISHWEESMTGRTHLTIGIATGLALAQTLNLPPKESALIIAAAALGSLLPDIDEPRAMLSGWIPGYRFLNIRPFRHRTLTHSLLFCILLPAVLWYALSAEVKLPIPYIYPLSIILGMCSHLLSDMLTPDGVPLLYPFPQKWKVLPGKVLSLTKWAGLEFVVWVGALGCIGWFVIN